VAPFTAEDLRSYTASFSASPCSFRESSSTRCSKYVLLVSALTSDVRASCRSRAFYGLQIISLSDIDPTYLAINGLAQLLNFNLAL